MALFLITSLVHMNVAANQLCDVVFLFVYVFQNLLMLKKLLIRCLQEKTQLVEEDREKVRQLQASVKEMESEIVDVKTYPCFIVERP